MFLTIDEREIRRHGPGHLLAVCWRQWRAERALARRGLHFRTTDLTELRRAYTAMTEAEFTAVNGRQAWANWRTIPRCLSGRAPDRPLRVLDLGCGAGDSTAVLAFYCPAGSHLTGLEVAEPLVEAARRRTYRHQSGEAAAVDFRCQGVGETLCDADGYPLPPGGVDLVNASGVVGHHLDRRSVAPLAAELARVLAPDGLALLDVGPTLGAAELAEALAPAGLVPVARCRSWRLDPTGQVVLRRR